MSVDNINGRTLQQFQLDLCAFLGLTPKDVVGVEIKCYVSAAPTVIVQYSPISALAGESPRRQYTLAEDVPPKVLGVAP